MKGSITLRKVMATALLSISMVFSLAASGQQESNVTASGTDTVVNKEFSSINEISLVGISDFTVEEGENCTLQLKGDQAYVEAVSLNNDNGFLEIQSDSDMPVTVNITVPSLVSLFLSEGTSGTFAMGDMEDSFTLYVIKDSSLAIESDLNAPELMFYVSESHVDGVINTNVMKIKGLSAANIDLTGYSHDLEFELFTDSVALLDGLNVDTAKINTSQSAVLEADFPGMSKVDVETHGSSSVILSMNGILSADVLADSSLVYSGDVNWVGKHVADGEDDDAFISRK
ncbi:MAG: hypothetical protein B6241_00415 [Spirochaetaceae bacterium 4572_59]|nr:MAG: hypothetical protein B6241_00415 [Spirochaetaceae bacterium 4572_59]